MQQYFYCRYTVSDRGIVETMEESRSINIGKEAQNEKYTIKMEGGKKWHVVFFGDGCWSLVVWAYSQWNSCSLFSSDRDRISGEDFKLFSSLGFDIVQGYYFSKPLTKSEIIDYIKVNINNKIS